MANTGIEVQCLFVEEASMMAGEKQLQNQNAFQSGYRL